MYPDQVNEAFGGKKQGAVARTTTFLVVFWIYLFERMRTGAAEEKETETETETEVENESGAPSTAKDDSATKPAAATGPSATRKRPGKGNRTHKDGEATIKPID